MKPFVPGMTLGPGESTRIELEQALPPDIAELVKRGQLSLEIKQGEARQYAPGKFRSSAVIVLGGEEYGSVHLTWESKPASLWGRIAQWWKTCRTRERTEPRGAAIVQSKKL